MSYIVNVNVEWDGYSWVGVVEGGGTTQAKNLDKLRKNVVEVVKLMRGDLITTEDVDLHVTVPGLVEGPQVDALAALREAALQISAVLTSAQVVLIDALKEAGFPLRDIGGVVGLSHQRVDQIIANTAVIDADAVLALSEAQLSDVVRASHEMRKLVVQGLAARGNRPTAPTPKVAAKRASK